MFSCTLEPTRLAGARSPATRSWLTFRHSGIFGPVRTGRQYAITIFFVFLFFASLSRRSLSGDTRVSVTVTVPVAAQKCHPHEAHSHTAMEAHASREVV